MIYFADIIFNFTKFFLFQLKTIVVTEVTKGIKVSVETFYQDDYSRPDENKYVFAYRITLENTGYQTVQLKRRHWKIMDSIGTLTEVEGEGVIGLQPILKPGELHQYVSWSQLTSDMGKMHGTYLFMNLVDNELFDVTIPEFKLVAPFKMN